jgi:hypothetical protein
MRSVGINAVHGHYGDGGGFVVFRPHRQDRARRRCGRALRCRGSSTLSRSSLVRGEANPARLYGVIPPNASVIIERKEVKYARTADVGRFSSSTMIWVVARDLGMTMVASSSVIPG